MRKRIVTISAGLILVLALAPQFSMASFTDVTNSHENYKAINYVQQHGIVNGYDDGTYKPENTINRAEFTKIVVNANYDTAKIDECISKNISDDLNYVFFPDVPRSEWYAKFVCVAKMNNIISGYPDGTFQPYNEINFTEAAKIITLGMGIEVGIDPLWYKPYVLVLEDKSAIPTRISNFDQMISRGEMAEMIYRLLAKIQTKPFMTFDEIQDGIISERISLYYGKPIENDATESYPIYVIDCFTDDCPTFPLWKDEWKLNTSNRFAFDDLRHDIIYPNPAGAFQLNKIDILEDNIDMNLAKKYAYTYLPAIQGDILAFVGSIDGRESVIKYNLSNSEIVGEPDAFQDFDTCSWPAVSKDQKVFAICLKNDNYSIVDEDGLSYYLSSNELKSLVLDLNNRLYFIENGGIKTMKLIDQTPNDFNTLSEEYVYSSLTVSPYGEYIVGKAQKDNQWFLILTDNIKEESKILLTFNQEPGMPSLLPYLDGSYERENICNNEWVQGGCDVTTYPENTDADCVVSYNPKDSIMKYLLATQDNDIDQMKACVTNNWKDDFQLKVDEFNSKNLQDLRCIDLINACVESGQKIIDVLPFELEETKPNGDVSILVDYYFENLRNYNYSVTFTMRKVDDEWLINSTEFYG
jgi:hypothetical protein